MAEYLWKKYEFDNEEQYTEALKSVGEYEEIEVAKDETWVNSLTPHNFAVIGYVLLELAEIDSDGNVTKEAVLSDKFSVDVLWEDLTESPSEFITYEISLDNIGVHGFAQQEYKG